MRFYQLPLYFLIFSLLSNCATPGIPNPHQQKALKAVHVNPYPPGTYDHFRAAKNYPLNYSVWKNKEVLSRMNPQTANITIDLSSQRAFLFSGKVLAMDYPISTGRMKYPTPTGAFRILEMAKSEKRSTVYGKIYDSNGKLVNSNADKRKDPIPPGGKYIGASMPFWMRLTWDGIGMHQGYVARRPVSHGCIRTPRHLVPLVFSKVKIGTPVTIID